MNEAARRISLLREHMKPGKIDAYLVPTADYHESEYVGDHFKCREYITGFTGSAGTALITRDWAGLWTDGRYFIQAAAQLAGSGVELMKQGQPNVPTLEEYLETHMPEGGILGFDGRSVNARMGENLERRLAAKNVSLACTEDLIGEIWEDRPRLSEEPLWVLDERYAGRPAANKIAALRAEMKYAGASVHLLTTLDDIMWLLNVRGGDIPHNPVALCYVAVTEWDLLLFINEKIVPPPVLDYLIRLGVELQPYQHVYDYVSGLRDERVLLEKSKVNYLILHDLDASNTVIDRMNPTVMAKAVKNDIEIANMRAAHVKDGVAMVKFIYWLKHEVGHTKISECDAADYLDQLRREQGAMDESFDTISAYGANAAMCHYHAEAKSCAMLEPKGFYLVDSGGQYLEGTTDVTRTIALGPLTDEEREHYTLVLISMLRLGNVRFLSGCSGLSLDYVAREPFWQRGLDFNHGTGHGVGYLLNVHERPVGIRYRVVPERQDSAPFAPGMICSDEPGIYIEGSHGIRTENMVCCQRAEKTEYGQFLRFEFLTLVPIDVEPLRLELMEDEDIRHLNEYHRLVYDELAPLLTAEEAGWLREATRPVTR
ncbi:MAG: aminopeptidase P family protein [Clostridiales bacterium]|nr:aminopeptidase P family protein [Clostridiales bacterium]